MQITKKFTGYITEDQTVFQTYGEAVGHAKRCAIAHYLQVIRHALHEENGPLSTKTKMNLRGISDAVEEILDEKPALIYADGTRGREQTPTLALAA